MHSERVMNVGRRGLIGPLGAAALAAAAVLSASRAEATNVSCTWSGASSTDFATTGNWVSNVAPTSGTPGTGDPMDGDFAIFGTNAGTVPNQPVLGANFGVRKLQFDGSGWTLGGSATLSVSRAGGIVTTNTTGTNTINANISLGVKDTAATLFNIAGSSSAGVLRLNGTIGKFSDPTSGSGAIIKTGGGTLEMNTTSGTITSWQVNGGAIKVIGGTAGLGTLNNVALAIGAGTFDLNGISVGAGGFSMSSSSGLLTSGTAATFTTTANGNGSVLGKISGALSMVYGNNGTDRVFTVSNATSDYTGTTRANSGNSLWLSADAPSGAAGTLGNATSVVQLGSTSGTFASTRVTQLLVTGAYSVGRDINIGTQGDTKSIGANATATAGTSTFSGTINVGLGTLTTAPALNVTAPSGHQVNITGQIVEATGASNTLLGALRKVGAGTVRLTNANSYVGGTSVEVGTLLVDNTTLSGTGSGDIAVFEDATLGGSGAMTGNVTLNADTADAGSFGGILQPTLATNALDIGGILTANAGAVLDLQYMTGLDSSATYTIVTYGSLSGTFAQGSIVNAPSTHEVSIQAKQIQLTPIPEPATVALFGLGTIGLLLRRRKIENA
jgi:autotransporter-associated beta strand protein